MSDEEKTDLKEIKTYLLGTEFDRKHGLDYQFNRLVSTVNEMQNTQLIMQNQISEIQKRKTLGGAIKNFILIFK